MVLAEGKPGMMTLRDLDVNLMESNAHAGVTHYL